MKFDTEDELNQETPAAAPQRDIPNPERMRVTFRGRRLIAQTKLQNCLDRASELRCAEHGERIDAVIINGRDNESFDSIWITCCRGLELQATAFLKDCI